MRLPLARLLVPTTATQIGTRESGVGVGGMMIGVEIRSGIRRDDDDDGGRKRRDLELVARNALESTEYKASERAVWRLRWSKWEFVR